MPARESKDIAQLVVTGSSAGGIEALSALVHSLPKDFAAPIVTAQHLDPTAHSVLGDILSKQTTLPVRVVIASEKLVAGAVYVVPNNRNVRIVANTGIVAECREGIQPSVDLLFMTAAEAFQEGVIAVVLSGMGSDGAVGARAVKRNGGMVIIQDPKTAKFPSMPQSLPPTSVDIVARLEAIGPLLHDILKGTYLPSEPAERNLLRTLLAQIRDDIGLDFSNYKTPTIVRRVSRLMAATGCQSLAQYIDFLKAHPDEYQRLISTFLIKVTEFFRDTELFEALGKQVLPKLIEEAVKGKKELRIWSAGCATGEEAYSLAITISEAMARHKDELDVRIFATDLDNNAVSFARRGIYAADALKDVPPDLLAKYFVRNDGAFEVSKRIRSMTVFGQHDLAQRAPFPRIDLALCRNVLIYFTKELQHRALQLFAYSVRGDGYLALGKSESTTPLPHYFEIVDPKTKIYRRRGDRPSVHLTDVQQTFVAAEKRHVSPPPPLRPQVERRVHAAPNEQIGSMLMHSPIGIVMVDRHYDIQLINSAARDLLNIRGIAVGDDLVHLVETIPSHELRGAIDAAFRMETSESMHQELRIADTTSGEQRFLQLVCYANSPSGTAVLLVADATHFVVRRLETERELSERRDQMEQLEHRHELLQRDHAQLLAANKEMMDANTILREDNARLLESVEESESSTEEIETLNEEMQATNEELETLNEELQAKVEELKTTNDELEARTRELQFALTSQEGKSVGVDSERAGLDKVLNALNVPLIIIDGKGSIIFQNGTYKTSGPKRAEDLSFTSHEHKNVSLGDFVRLAHKKNGEWFVPGSDGARKKRFRVSAQPIGIGQGKTATLLTFLETDPAKD